MSSATGSHTSRALRWALLEGSGSWRALNPPLSKSLWAASIACARLYCCASILVAISWLILACKPLIFYDMLRKRIDQICLDLALHLFAGPIRQRLSRRVLLANPSLVPASKKQLNDIRCCGYPDFALCVLCCHYGLLYHNLARSLSFRTTKGARLRVAAWLLLFRRVYLEPR